MLKDVNLFSRVMFLRTVFNVKSFKYDDLKTMSPEQIKDFLSKNYGVLANAYNKNLKLDFLTKEESLKCHTECHRINTIRKLASLKEAGELITSNEVKEIIDLGVTGISLQYNYFRAFQALSGETTEELEKQIPFPSKPPSFSSVMKELYETRDRNIRFDEDRKAGMSDEQLEEKYGMRIYSSSKSKNVLA